MIEPLQAVLIRMLLNEIKKLVINLGSVLDSAVRTVWRSIRGKMHSFLKLLLAFD